MLVIPAIDIMNGHCVRLVRGDFDQRTVYSDDPATIAVDFARAGAERLHVVDLDAARGEHDNRTVIEAVIEAGLTIQVAGGIRTSAQVEAWISAGAGSVVMGTAAVREPELLAECAHSFPSHVMAALDVRDGLPAVSGWTETEPLDISELIPRWNVLPLAGIILTCTERDGTLAGPDLATLERVLGMTELPVQYGGGISSLHDIRRVREARAAGVILGRSLYEGKLSLEQALAL
ncbi:MAG: 1-(5-phosphoribosyl)-5-[(5-phosphoribosylamino)methylideneamino]imidazole-4-carboxamide isomerase [Chloroflexi bacterium]|nr:MAG: 1-(5-phosphoribosyl)-5-[(5-phosphoribosylamino)methylideneamino]imidazole-4-carboxamide isomerase [Chloroflexota bacterium]TME53829.1 MAG: 1-(5-phosphoribosyl)-5-[(5-phosphoribosylamino)methylideneamino]imidazole-4-carboxamide isomerase [Chloroflexota bacterium]